MATVRNRRNRVVVEAARLHRARVRRERGQALLEGPNLLDEATAASTSIDTVFARPSDARSAAAAAAFGLRLSPVDDGALALLAATASPRGPITLIDVPESALDPGRDVLASVGVSDPANVGAMIRVAAAFGWGYAHTPGSADPWSPKALRAGAGGQLQTSVVAIDDVGDLAPRQIVAAVVDGGDDLSSVGPGRAAVLIGGEAAGLPADVAAMADSRVTIAMTGPTESLNAATAAAIAVHAISGAKGGLGGRA